MYVNTLLAIIETVHANRNRGVDLRPIFTPLNELIFQQN